ncbi:DUF4282 domain-containing protein [Actinomadura sp. NAK00032]|uniref:DUF4282 domain-containing protein n=1 Tax=Actinomadura sp. NAK00032 TaxID=2742128 RepID=UPI00159B2B30|nr:DUF4282 domain-containing protein [Actinomadura sp. NAK00032]QKW34158.1 DUF4282 domain-containing protein [Actinomadura sp. NAK00032]
MTNPSDPGHPPRSQAPGPPGGPYGPPPGPQQPAPVPGPRQPAPGAPGAAPQGQQGQQGWLPPERTDKGLLGALLDANFDSLVTPKLLKLFYALSMVMVTLECLAIVGFAIWIISMDFYWAVALLLIIATPLIWFFQMLFVRILMEAVVVRFKQAEYLRVIKDKV